MGQGHDPSPMVHDIGPMSCGLSDGPVVCPMALSKTYRPILCPVALAYDLWPCHVSYGPWRGHPVSWPIPMAYGPAMCHGPVLCPVAQHGENGHNVMVHPHKQFMYITT